MKNNLQTRRQKLLRDLQRVNQQIALTQKSLARIGSRIASLRPAHAKAA